MSVLLIQLAGPDAPARWARAAPSGALQDGGEIARPFAGQLAGMEAERVIVLVPGEDVAAHLVDLPAASEAQTRAAARFAVEDELSVPADSVHLALGPAPAEGGPRLAAVAAHAAMESWLADARALGAEPDAVAPDWAALPGAARTAAALVRNGRAVVRLDGPKACWGFAAAPDLAAAILDRALERFDCGRVHVWGEGDAIAPPAGWGGREIAGKAAPDSDAQVFALAFAQEGGAPAVDLLQGAYAPRRAGAGFAPWRRAAALAVAALGLWLALTVAETRAIDARADALTAEAEAVFAQAFPEVGRIVNPRLQMQTELSALRGRGGGAFLDQAAVLVGAAAEREGVEVAALRYDRNSGALDAELVFSDFADLQAVREAVAARGGVLEEGASRQAGAGRIAGDVTVRLP